MSERTTIGGTVYESVGSSSSNLLLKCNGTARIQWGSKLIDLIKNGKIASENSSSPMIFNIKDESEIKTDGIYVLTKDENTQILICKDKIKYDLTNTKLYIAADTEQSLTSDQKKCALLNIGAYYNTYSDLEQAKVKDGIVYVMDTKTLYTIQNGIIEEFEAKLKTISVNQSETGNIINDSVQIVLSVNDEQYLILANGGIISKQSIQIHPEAQIGSEGANSSQGYRLFIDGGVSVLEVDEIRVRNGIPQNDYIKVTYAKLCDKIAKDDLSPNMWYLIEDFQNHWKLPAEDNKYNRPILIRAITKNSFYKEGLLFEDQRITIQYDPNYTEIFWTDIKSFQARGRITFMRDENGNEANFDFLDYYDCNDKELTLLYDRSNITGKTIFPPQSYNNKLTVYDLIGVDIDTKGYLYTNKTGTVIQFGYTPQQQQKAWDGEFHDNIIECRANFTIESKCKKFYNNKFEKVGNVVITNNIYDSNISNLYSIIETEASIVNEAVEDDAEGKQDAKDVQDIYPITEYNSELNYQDKVISDFVKLENLTNNSFEKIILTAEIINSTFKGLIKSSINARIVNSSFGIVTYTTFGDQEEANKLNTFKNFQFKNIYNCEFHTNGKDLLDILCVFDIHNCTFKYKKPDNWDDTIPYNPAFYDPAFAKELTLIINKNKYYIKVLRKREQTFFRGMIVMHSGKTAIPEGWAMCDGKEYEYLGEKIETPNLVDRFIKGVADPLLVGEVINDDLVYKTEKDESGNDVTVWTNQLTLKPEHLPEHHHPHQQHTHEISGTTVTIHDSEELDLTAQQSINTFDVYQPKNSAIITIGEDTGQFVTNVDITPQRNYEPLDINGGIHTHNVTVTEGTIDNSVSQEETQTWENKAIKIEPHYYSLIFIMKL